MEVCAVPKSFNNSEYNVTAADLDREMVDSAALQYDTILDFRQAIADTIPMHVRVYACVWRNHSAHVQRHHQQSSESNHFHCVVHWCVVFLFHIWRNGICVAF